MPHCERSLTIRESGLVRFSPMPGLHTSSLMLKNKLPCEHSSGDGSPPQRSRSNGKLNNDRLAHHRFKAFSQTDNR